MPDAEMRRVFNMGLGMIVIVAADEADGIIEGTPAFIKLAVWWNSSTTSECCLRSRNRRTSCAWAYWYQVKALIYRPYWTRLHAESWTRR